MIPSSKLRGRNIEDIGEIEEKGLLRRMESNESADGSTRRRDKGKEKERNGWIQVNQDEGEAEGEGLVSTRDKQAFALLVLLCKYL